MRLLNTSILQFHEFHERVPSYAIFSHTWQDEEVTFQEILNCDSNVQRKAGYAKILNFCQIAARGGFEYGWVDTCCIDKINLTELSEAINSMLRWYKAASACIAYLCDILMASSNGDDLKLHQKSLGRSRWFTRGWTLQELLAPANVDFYCAEWRFVTTKRDSMRYLSEITGINEMALSDADFQMFSVAARMSWAAKRTTTRTEDIAYCLMRIFDVNMPLLYGEGDRAYVRLQEELVRGNNDQSIFAWDAEHSNSHEQWLSVFSPSPAFFSSKIERMIEGAGWNNFSFKRMPYTITNMGLSITLPIVKSSSIWDSDETYAVLDCRIDGEPVCIQLETTEQIDTHRYCRRPGHIVTTLGMLEGRRCTVEEVYIATRRYWKREHYVDKLRNADTGRWSTQKREAHKYWSFLKDELLALDTIGGTLGSNKAWLISDVVAFAYITCFGAWPFNSLMHGIDAAWLRENLAENTRLITFMLFILILDWQCLMILTAGTLAILSFYRTLSYFLFRWLAHNLLAYDGRVELSVSIIAEEFLCRSDRVRNYTNRWGKRSWPMVSSVLQHFPNVARALLKPLLLFEAFDAAVNVFEILSLTWSEGPFEKSDLGLFLLAILIFQLVKIWTRRGRRSEYSAYQGKGRAVR